jgi:hypothetical protein
MLTLLFGLLVVVGEVCWREFVEGRRKGKSDEKEMPPPKKVGEREKRSSSCMPAEPGGASE